MTKMLQYEELSTCFRVEGGETLLWSLALGAAVFRIGLSEGKRVTCISFVFHEPYTRSSINESCMIA